MGLAAHHYIILHLSVVVHFKKQMKIPTSVCCFEKWGKGRESKFFSFFFFLKQKQRQYIFLLILFIAQVEIYEAHW